MKYQFIDRYRFVYRVEKMCQVLNIGRSPDQSGLHMEES